jgi:hypothetical protein
MKQESFKHQFVEFIPEELQDGTLYVSMRFATVAHLCACGCGTKVVTPLKPTDWMLMFDGKTITLDPSIGNWSFPCRSHYWIKKNRVRWAEDWSRSRIEANRADDRWAKEKYFGAAEDAAPARQSVRQKQPEKAWWKTLWPW